MADMARILIILGVVLIAIGLALLLFHKTPFPGRLPGDFVIKREHFTFYFPLATSIILSIIISLVLYLISKFR
jgi:ribose/xylose/arabinose/galactoside ABC-type transport system permease subunit